jgi:hypothetical protein
MAIFNSYVKLPEGNGEAILDVPNMLPEVPRNLDANDETFSGR